MCDRVVLDGQTCMTDGCATKITYKPFIGQLVRHNFVHDLFSKCTVTNQHIKLHIMHTKTILHGQNDLTMILARSSQDIANSQDHGQNPPMWDLSALFSMYPTKFARTNILFHPHIHWVCVF